MLKITSAQINPTIGDIDGNLKLMLDAALKAQAEGSHLVVFPELSLTAYYPGDLLDERVFQDRLERGIADMVEASRATPDVAWVAGAPVRRNGVGKLYHNAILVLLNGQVVLVYHKQLLPTYGIFDERRHFEPGADATRILRIGDAQVGLMICEDGWNDEGADYPLNPFQRLADAAPDLIVSINASPSNIGKREQRHAVFGKACARHNLPLLYVNQVGGHDQLVYDGASFALSRTGELVYEARRFESDIATLAFETRTQSFCTPEGDELAPVPAGGLETLEFYRRQIVLGLRDYVRRCGFSKVVVGSSGGIDSALTLALAVEALGAQNVAAITMPSKFSSEGSVSDSAALCTNLGILLDECAIRDIVKSFEAGMAGSTLMTKPSGLALENLQARIRGTLLMTYSNMYGNMVLTTGNKSEISVGYCTLYGDTNGGLGLIGDLYKTEVFDLCRHINKCAGKEVIPVAIIEKEPSAELAPGQRDVDSLPPYPVLDDILRLLLEDGRLAVAEAENANRTQAELESTEDGRALIARIHRMVSRNEYKRRQAPPILRLRARAFGSGRQMPIAAVHY